MDEFVSEMKVDHATLIEENAIVRQPFNIGSYSIKCNPTTGYRRFVSDDASVKWLHVPLIGDGGLDLKDGFNYGINWSNYPNAKLDELLQWILLNRYKFAAANETHPNSLHTHFVTYCELLTKIMTTPYDNINQEGWTISATKFRGTIYLNLHQEKFFLTPDDYYNCLLYSDYRFKAYVTSSCREKATDTKESATDVGQSELRCVVRSKISDKHSMVYGVKIDCIDPYKVEALGTMSQYIELKTAKCVTNEQQFENFCRNDLIKWWAETYIAGVNTIVCGYRNEKLMVKEVKVLPSDSLPGLSHGFWSTSICLSFLDDFLSFVKDCITEDNPYAVYQFHWQPNQSIICKRLYDSRRMCLLPDWYIKEFS